jgi:hypothetical protein
MPKENQPSFVMLSVAKHLGTLLSTQSVIARHPPRCFATLSMTGGSWFAASYTGATELEHGRQGSRNQDRYCSRAEYGMTFVYPFLNLIGY